MAIVSKEAKEMIWHNSYILSMKKGCWFDAIASRLEAIAIRAEAIAIRGEAIASRKGLRRVVK